MTVDLETEVSLSCRVLSFHNEKLFEPGCVVVIPAGSIAVVIL